MQKVLLTGATGFIGRHCLPRLVDRGFDVHVVSSRSDEQESADDSGATWHHADLLELGRIAELLDRVRPSHMLHLAWGMVPGKWGSAENLRWVQAGLELMRQFQRVEGARVVMAGSGAEYDWSYGYCAEERTPTVPATSYGACKNALSGLLRAYARETGLSAAWARIFFLYGPHEHPQRLVPSVIRSLLQGHPAECSHGNQIRDYLHVADVAAALVALLESDVSGPVNVASGTEVTLRDLVNRAAEIIGRPELVRFGARPEAPQDAPRVVADVDRLHREVGWTPSLDLEAGMRQTVEFWENELRSIAQGTS